MMINNNYLNTLTSKALMDKAFGDIKANNSYQNKQNLQNFDDMLRQPMKKVSTVEKNDFSRKDIDLKKLKEQTDAFESIMIKTVLDLSLKQEASLFPKAVGSDIYSDMYNDALSKSIGGGIGFSDLLYDFLKERV